ncbi:hypothetical protein JCM8547_003667 [Rhodosporidiobolus lusitaniae]
METRRPSLADRIGGKSNFVPLDNGYPPRKTRKRRSSFEGAEREEVNVKEEGRKKQRREEEKLYEGKGKASRREGERRRSSYEYRMKTDGEPEGKKALVGTGKEEVSKPDRLTFTIEIPVKSAALFLVSDVSCKAFIERTSSCELSLSTGNGKVELEIAVENEDDLYKAVDKVEESVRIEVPGWRVPKPGLPSYSRHRGRSNSDTPTSGDFPPTPASLYAHRRSSASTALSSPTDTRPPARRPKDPSRFSTSGAASGGYDYNLREGKEESPSYPFPRQPSALSDTRTKESTDEGELREKAEESRSANGRRSSMEGKNGGQGDSRSKPAGKAVEKLVPMEVEKQDEQAAPATASLVQSISNPTFQSTSTQDYASYNPFGASFPFSYLSSASAYPAYTFPYASMTPYSYPSTSYPCAPAPAAARRPSLAPANAPAGPRRSEGQSSPAMQRGKWGSWGSNAGGRGARYW